MNDRDLSPRSTREVRYEVTHGFVPLLQRFGCTLLVSTYQAGKLVAIRSINGQLGLSFHNFQQAMGVAASETEIIIGGSGVVWTLKSAPLIAEQMRGREGHDACFLARSGRVCDDIHLHELAKGRAGLWVVNTKFSCLCTLDGDYSFVPRWQPNFVTALAPEDRCHLNGLAMSNGKPAYVSVMGRTDTPKGWRADKVTGGCVLDVESHFPVVTELSMPHSPRLYRGQLFVLDSGRGHFGFVENPGVHGKFRPLSRLPGFTRGLAFHGPYAMVGLSKIRETRTFGGVPIGEDSSSLKCAIAIIDLRTGRKVEHLEFVTGVDEIFDVQVLANVTNPFIGGIYPETDETPTIWAVPPAASIPALSPADNISKHSGMVLANSAVRSGDSTPKSLHDFMRGLDRLKEADYPAAQLAFEEALQESPRMVDAWCNSGVVAQLLDQLDLSEQKLRRAIELQPEMPAAHFNLAMTLLLQNKLAEGWDEYEWRWRCESFGNQPPAIEALAPAWQGEPLANQTVLVYGEQGIGDEVMFHSCLHELIKQAGRVLVSCEARLEPLLRRSFPQAIVFQADRMDSDLWRSQLGRIDYQIAVGSLPRWFRRHAESFDAGGAYLQADDRLLEYWQDKFSDSKPKIGISWCGGLRQDRKFRSLPLGQWRSFLERFDATWISLQYGNHHNELRELRKDTGISVDSPARIDPLSELDDYCALLKSLDLVVSVDNSTVHFAGALGVPTLAMVVFPSTSHWRWGRTADVTHWYQSVQLVRKEPDRSWDEVLAQVASLTNDRIGHAH